MTATLVWAKELRLQETRLPTGELYLEVAGEDVGYEFPSWADVRDMQTIASIHGVDPSEWPVYAECEVESGIPLDEVQIRSSNLRRVLGVIPEKDVADKFWSDYCVTDVHFSSSLTANR